MRKHNLLAKLALVGLVICAVGVMPLQAQKWIDLIWSWGNGWTLSPNLGLARAGHTATVLRDGKVLVVGGSGGSGNLRIAELYDPATGAWALAANPLYGRSLHTATLLPNGEVLVMGGHSTTDVEVYDPGRGIWYVSRGRLKTARPQGHTATLLPNGKVLVVGGSGGSFLNSAELFDPVRGTSGRTGSLNYGRYTHTATLLPNGKVLVVGGSQVDGIGNTAELYDPATGLWTLTGGLFYARYQHAATRLQDGRVLISGGLSSFNNCPRPLDSVELYDPATGNWYSVGGLNFARRMHQATLLPDGRVLVVGGDQPLCGQYPILNSSELYDPATFTWTPTDNLNVSRVNHTVTLLANGKVLIVGGLGGQNLTYSNWYAPTVSSVEFHGGYIFATPPINF
jgi:WD40 repeat protein